MTIYKQFPQINALDWATVQPHFDALLAIDLNAQTIDNWLQQWSDLEAVLDEAARTDLPRGNREHRRRGC